MKHFYAAFLAGLLITQTAAAQRMLGISNSAWGGTTGLQLNPAHVADSRHRFVIDLASVNAGVDNDGASINPSDALNRLTSGDSSTIASIFAFKEGSSFNLTAPYIDVKGPGALVSIRRHGIALTTRLRAINQFSDFDQRFYRTILDQNYRNVSDDYKIQSGRFDWNVHIWSDIGLSYGTVLLERGKHFLKGGVTLHYLSGIGYVNFRGSSLDGRYYSAQDSIRVNQSEASFSSNVIANDDQLAGGLSASSVTDYFFGDKGGRGFGLDLGFIYEFRPHPEGTLYNMDGRTGLHDRSQPSYRLRVSAAVTDLGSIRYRDGNYRASLNGAASFKGSELAGQFNTFPEFQSYAGKRGLNVTYDSGYATRVSLPTSVVLGADYHVTRRLYASLTYIASVVDRHGVGAHVYDQVTLTPRYDSRIFSVGVPITYSGLTQRMKMGIGARVSGFYIGSDDALAILGSSGQTGVNFYFGAFVPVNRRRPRDRDRDGVSDRYDRCPRERGTWDDRGCPPADTDGDGLPDAEDACPDEAGSLALDGCPDRDKDNVADDEDRCPDVPGLPELGGCPDGDRDGVADKDDACPTVPGPVRFDGCPDSDGDGLPDPKDKCPKEPGLPANAGCPVKPVVQAAVRERLAFAATAIQFETGKAVLRKSSNGIITEIAGILDHYPLYNMTLEGHTDDVGTPAANLALSRARAEAVRQALIGKGIAPERLFAAGFGVAFPVAPNTTPAGRAKNRRVVLELKSR